MITRHSNQRGQVVSVFKLFIFTIVTILIVAFSCTQPQSRPHEGAWNLVYFKSVNSDTITNLFPGDLTGSDMKLWAKNHFSFVGRFQWVEDTTFNNWGGGTYILEGTHYQEFLTYHVNTDWVGATPKMLLEVRGDTLVQTYPADENWQIDQSNYTVEKYVRFE